MKRIMAFVILFMLLTSVAFAGKPKIGLALSGGGARGFAHVGVLKIIDELGIEIDYIAGTSMGAVVGGLYAIGYTAVEIEEILKGIDWDDIFTDEIKRKNFYIGEKRWNKQSNLYFYVKDNQYQPYRQGFIDGQNIITRLFKETFRYSHINDFNNLPIPFACVATDLLTGDMVVIDSGSLQEAMRASMSIPSLMSSFQLEGTLLIDGGIKMNLPAPLVRSMGADIVIGVLVGSDLRGIERLNNPVSVLDQTINIGITEQEKPALKDCDILIEPDLHGIFAADFNKLDEIIMAGENEISSKALSSLRSLSSESSSIKARRRLSEETSQTVKFKSFSVEGNNYLSSSKVREYTKLSIDGELTAEDILKGINSAYHSDLFEVVYPVIRSEDDDYHLIVKVRERPRAKVGLNLRYNETDQAIIGIIVEMRNKFGTNSSFLVGFSAGGQRELLVDYVKNYGREFGAYYRLFPYINEKRLYAYEGQERVSSSKSLEYGAVMGVGGYAFNRVIVEGFLFSFYNSLYRDISQDNISDKLFSSGFGLKLYYESLDDIDFPMSGAKILNKYNYSHEDYFSDFSYQKFSSLFQYYLPLSSTNSLATRFTYGSYFNENHPGYDPFYVGGMDSFLGLSRRERSASIVKIVSLSSRSKVKKNVFLDLQLNMANLGEVDTWTIDDRTVFGGGLTIGVRSLLGPLRFGIGITDTKKINTYLSLGYDYDAFEFSRR
jgi:NTE family protein